MSLNVSDKLKEHVSLQVMIQILKDMGITEYEPRVINQMLEFTYSE